MNWNEPEQAAAEPIRSPAEKGFLLSSSAYPALASLQQEDPFGDLVMTSVKELARRTTLKRTSIFAMLKDQTLASVKVRNRRLIYVDSARELLGLPTRGGQK